MHTSKLARFFLVVRKKLRYRKYGLKREIAISVFIVINNVLKYLFKKNSCVDAFG